MPLTDTTIRNAKPGDKSVKPYDERWLFLIVTAAGGKGWRFRYSFAGKEGLLSLGTYPDVTLKDARAKREAARRLMAQGLTWCRAESRKGSRRGADRELS